MDGWVVRIEEKDYPAENLAMLRDWAQQGRIKPSNYVLNPTFQRWMYARDVEELKGYLGAASQRLGRYVCTHCRAVGNPVTRVKGSFLMEVVLWLLLLIPGFIYSFWRLTSKEKVCPVCGQPAMIPVETPEGQRLLSQLA